VSLPLARDISPFAGVGPVKRPGWQTKEVDAAYVFGRGIAR
jgi:hypothetical protein